MSWAIRVENLSKRYRIRHAAERVPYRSLRDDVVSIATAPLRRLRGQRGTTEDFWALKDVCFEVKQGEVLGIIGRNGAGKSTLLKLLSRITKPTSGCARLRGRVGSLLEVGTGFHPELTGRENIYLSGAVLGMTRREVRRKFDEIVDFAGVERFLDTPAKRYSSGMYVRLGFAVAAHLDPEILLVDEVLAVGDNHFRKKCLDKMQSVAGDGRTVAFVSHDLNAVSTLTSRTLLLSDGKIDFDGHTPDTLHRYLAERECSSAIYIGKTSEDSPRITRVEVTTSEPGNVQRHECEMEIHIELHTPRAIPDTRLACQVLNHLGQPILHLAAFGRQIDFCRRPGSYALVCRLPNLRLYMGEYSLAVHFGAGLAYERLDYVDNICPFEVVMHGKHREYCWSPNVCAYVDESFWSIC